MVVKKTTDQLVSERPDSDQIQTLARTPISLIVDNVRSLDNVGLIFRTAELARLEHLYLTGYTGYPETVGDTRPPAQVDRHNRRIEKTAVYAVPHQPWSHLEDPVPLIKKLKAQDHVIIALEQTTTSVPYHQVPLADYRLPLTIILGHERQGVRQELVDLADQIVEIPINGIGNSHNVAISTAIVLHHILDKTGQI